MVEELLKEKKLIINKLTDPEIKKRMELSFIKLISEYIIESNESGIEIEVDLLFQQVLPLYIITDELKPE